MTASEPNAERLSDLDRPASSEEATLVAALRAGDETAFTALIENYHAALIGLALLFVDDRTVAEEVVQETWIGVLQGIGRFEGRSSLRTWLFRILTNRAKRRGQRESRTLPFSAIASRELERDEPAVDPDRFYPPGEQWAGHWISAPSSWQGEPEHSLLAGEARHVIKEAIDALPLAQQRVITLRDIDGWSAAEVCNVLGVHETNQRVLLHRARSKVRRVLEQYLDGEQRSK